MANIWEATIKNIKNYTLSRCSASDCDLQHCMCGTHDSKEKYHKCKSPAEDQ